MDWFPTTTDVGSVQIKKKGKSKKNPKKQKKQDQLISYCKIHGLLNNLNPFLLP